MTSKLTDRIAALEHELQRLHDTNAWLLVAVIALQLRRQPRQPAIVQILLAAAEDLPGEVAAKFRAVRRAREALMASVPRSEKVN